MNAYRQDAVRYAVGAMLSAEEAAAVIGNAGGGWFTTGNGYRVYICEGSHKDGTRGFKVLQVGGLQ